jgi:hypothetical protein
MLPSVPVRFRRRNDAPLIGERATTRGRIAINCGGECAGLK